MSSLAPFNASSRLLIVTDAWRPQINGVVRTLESVGQALARGGLDVHYLTPQLFWTVPVPTYPEIRISLATPGAVARAIDSVAPDHIHVATEGPLGFSSVRTTPLICGRQASVTINRRGDEETS